MKLDIRKKIKSSFLYKRFAYYQSEGFIELIKFLKDENLIYEFFDEFDFNNSIIERDLILKNKEIKLFDFFHVSYYSFSFLLSKRGCYFWNDKIFNNKNFEKISDKIL